MYKDISNTCYKAHTLSEQDDLEETRDIFTQKFSEEPKRDDLTLLAPKQEDPTDQVPCHLLSSVGRMSAAARSQHPCQSQALLPTKMSQQLLTLLFWISPAAIHLCVSVSTDVCVLPK
jgi:hypothetical protein